MLDSLRTSTITIVYKFSTLGLLLLITLGISSNLGAESMSNNLYTTVIVTFPLRDGVTVEAAKSMFEASAPTYQKIPGLIRKVYLYGEGPIGGGVYLWESREAAETLYTKAWSDGLAERIGTQPTIQYFYSPVVVDNS